MYDIEFKDMPVLAINEQPFRLKGAEADPQAAGDQGQPQGPAVTVGQKSAPQYAEGSSLGHKAVVGALEGAGVSTTDRGNTLDNHADVHDTHDEAHGKMVAAGYQHVQSHTQDADGNSGSGGGTVKRDTYQKGSQHVVLERQTGGTTQRGFGGSMASAPCSGKAYAFKASGMK